MTPTSGHTWHQNPFPLSPVVRLGPLSDLGDARVRAADSGNAHIDTPLIKDVEGLVDDYFAPPAAGGRRGRAIALVGEFGLGKSHALRRTYQTIRARHAETATWIVDEPAQDMGRLYRDRLRGPGDTEQGKRAFEELVRDYYAYVTAGWVGAADDDPRRGTLREIATGLRDRVLDPDKVVSALRYDPEVIHADLRGTLGDVTEHRRYSTALALLLEPPFNRMVWNWLNGAEPAEPLRERGITEAIGPSDGRHDLAAGIDRVFDALTVQGFLHGRVGQPYVLLLDSLEKVLDWPADNRGAFMDAFERLINIYTSHGGLLVFCSSPDGLRALRQSVHERVVQLWPTGLDQDRTGKLVARYLASGGEADGSGGADGALDTNGTGEVTAGADGTSEPSPATGAAPPPTGPFDDEALRLLHELTEGVPREVLKTCREAWQLSEDTAGLVRRVPGVTVLKAVRALHERVSYQRVMGDVHDALNLGQWRIASRDPVPARLARSAGGREEVLYWLSPAPNAYIAVVYARSLLLADDVERIVTQVNGLRGAVRPGRFEALLVVNGLVSHAMQDRLGRSIGSRPLVYRQGGFPKKVHEALLQLERRLVEEGREEDLAELGERMRRNLAQQTAHLDEMRRNLAAMTLEVRPGATGAPGGTPQSVHTAPEAEPAEELPGPVWRRFRDALAMLESVTRRVAGRTMNRRTAASAAELSVLGCATLVRALTEDFRGAVATWARAATPGSPTEVQLSELRRICREYESAVEVLPVHLLGNAEHQHPLTPARTVEVLAEEVWGTLSAPAVP
ncbi:hypothetical protein ACKI1I_03990 [Streptomyces turgidiscabies]|uniref:Uncharacterized protein n=1 Tax=Streptomyces turgidiscabies (strain Car8) TaxID=698760 RepID=L7FD60_STRT8|nr:MULTISPECIES: hypothetical protein [Streptomyces]ELP68565.1 hypothetical protein STRTUCAR8_03528 [Streptomyces turgidiscabies Car8]MDX3494130.1 hypothetical protein [Streptomyces turgidiscabies]GAQ68499.1 hypothetical protein T45_00210 [Streptomyces turgidiscabies]